MSINGDPHTSFSHLKTTTSQGYSYPQYPQPVQPPQHIQPAYLPARLQSPRPHDPYANPSGVGRNNTRPLPPAPRQPAIPPQHQPTQQQYAPIHQIQAGLSVPPLPPPSGQSNSGTQEAPLPSPQKRRDAGSQNDAPLVPDRRPSTTNSAPTNAYPPVRPPHHSGSPPRSSSLASERIAQGSGGGNDTLDSNNADIAEMDPNQATTTPDSYKNPQRTIPPSLRPQSPLSAVEMGLTEPTPLRIIKRNLPSLPPQPLSPGESRSPSMEDSSTLPTRRLPWAVSSDAALERERALENSELAELHFRARQQEAEEREKQWIRERQREVQRRLQPKSRGFGSEHWTVIPSDIPHSDYKKERPAIHDGPRPPPSRRGQSYTGYSPRNTPTEGRNSGRPVGTPVPTNWAVSWVSPTLSTPTYRSSQSIEDGRTNTADHSTPLQPGKHGRPLPLPMTLPLTPATTRMPPMPNFADCAIEPSPGGITSTVDESSAEPTAKRYPRMSDFTGNSLQIPFPKGDLDEPVTEASSSGTPFKFAETPQLVPAPDRRKSKKAIRAVAKRKLDGTSRVTPVATPRNQSTGSKVERVTAEQVENASSALSAPVEFPSEPRRAFCRE
jgi:hypothetical protein